MNGNDNWLIHEHSLYENLLSQCTEAVEIEDWKTVNLLFKRLVTHLKRHMALEEEVLYPAYEAAAHAPQGPTSALREEHDHIVRLIMDMARVIKTRDSDYVLECLAQIWQGRPHSLRRRSQSKIRSGAGIASAAPSGQRYLQKNLRLKTAMTSSARA